MAQLLTPDGIQTTVTPANPSTGFTFEEVYQLLDTDIVEVVYFPARVKFQGITYGMALIDEEGKFKDKRVNAKATMLWAHAHGIKTLGALGDYLVGNVLFVTEEEFQ